MRHLEVQVQLLIWFDFFAERGVPAAAGRYFFNGIDTETNGLDIVATMREDVAGGSLLLKAAMNFNDTELLTE